MKLQYGDMPNVEEAIDLGVVPEAVAPPTFENRSEYPNTPDMVNLLQAHQGTPIPPHRRVLMTIQHYREAGVFSREEKLVPCRVEIPGLGTLVFQRDRMGWGDDWVVLGKDGSVINS